MRLASPTWGAVLTAHIRRRSVAPVFFVLFSVLSATTSALAQQNDSSSGSATPPSAAASNQPTVLLLVDTSGSMAGTKIEQAKHALTTSVAALGPSQPAGLRSYAGECGNRGILRVPIGPDNRDALRDSVASLTAGGGTPTPDALLGAATDLAGIAGPRTIVLVSDGESTCGDPCPTAKAIKSEQGIAFTVHTVGFQAPAAAEGELACIAEATGGQYVSATDAAGLSEAIGSAINGKADCFAKLLQPHIDRLGPLGAQAQPYIDSIILELKKIPNLCALLAQRPSPPPTLPPPPPTLPLPPPNTIELLRRELSDLRTIAYGVCIGRSTPSQAAALLLGVSLPVIALSVPVTLLYNLASGTTGACKFSYELQKIVDAIDRAPEGSVVTYSFTFTEIEHFGLIPRYTCEVRMQVNDEVRNVKYAGRCPSP